MMIIIYFTVAFFVAVFATAISYSLYEGDSKVARAAENVALLCLFWPVLAVYALLRLIPALLRRAGWVIR